MNKQLELELIITVESKENSNSNYTNSAEKKSILKREYIKEIKEVENKCRLINNITGNPTVITDAKLIVEKYLRKIEITYRYEGKIKQKKFTKDEFYKLI